VRGDDLPEDIPMYGYGSGYVPLEQESLDQWLDVLKVHVRKKGLYPALSLLQVRQLFVRCCRQSVVFPVV
jgi:hypothetical protein